MRAGGGAAVTTCNLTLKVPDSFGPFRFLHDSITATSVVGCSSVRPCFSFFVALRGNRPRIFHFWDVRHVSIATSAGTHTQWSTACESLALQPPSFSPCLPLLGRLLLPCGGTVERGPVTGGPRSVARIMMQVLVVCCAHPPHHTHTRAMPGLLV